MRLSVVVSGEMLDIEVSDNGPGFPPGFTLASSSGHALRNIADRLKGYYGEMGQVCWDSAANLTRVRLRIPFQAAAETNGSGKSDSYPDRRR